MSRDALNLPVIQNWSCHNCGGCCREHLIEITDEEKRRIDKQGWKASDFDVAGDLLIPLGKNSYRIAHQSDGACAFLNSDGLCRIHARYGEPAKPLACRVYPYAFHPSGRKELTVSLRFSCPSVVQNLGASVPGQAEDLAAMGRQIVRGKNREHTAPLIHKHSTHGPQQVTWADFHQFLNALDNAFSDESVDFVVRLMRVLSWLDLVEASQFQTIKGQKLTEFLQLITSAAAKAQPDNDMPIHRPGRMARIMFRLIAGQFARHDTEDDYRRGLGMRFELFVAAMKFSTGLGTVPLLRGSSSVATAFGQNENDSGRSARFGHLETAFNGRTNEIDELFARYFRVKIQGIHFCGPAHYDTSLVDGFRCLALMYPVVMWLARHRAYRRGENSLALSDVQAALATADHNFGYSPALGTASALNRVSILARMKQLTSLVGWYSQ